jgi:hypothetical protein
MEGDLTRPQVVIYVIANILVVCQTSKRIYDATG